jgi:hypothetical protein
MKNIYFLFSMFCFFNFSTKAQTINISHQFPGESILYPSKGLEKVGWVKQIGNNYATVKMDSTQNFITVLDTSLTVASLNFPANGGGQTICGSTMDENDQMHGLFFDWNCWVDSTSTSNYFGNGCYFLYDFQNQQRHYFYFNTNTFVQPQNITSDMDYNLLWKNDTLIITLQSTDISASGTNYGYCLKFLNYQLIQQGELSVLGYGVDVFIDNSGRLNQLYDEVLGGNRIQNDGVNYSTILTPNASTYYADATLSDTTLYILQNHFSSSNENDSILIFSGNSITATSSIMSGLLSKKVMCKDHAGRIWVAKNDSVYMYNGINWLTYSFNGLNLINSSTPSPFPHKSFIEYKRNCFALSFSDDLQNNYGNGLLLFCYQDSTITTSISTENFAPTQNISIFPNPTSNVAFLEVNSIKDCEAQIKIYNHSGASALEVRNTKVNAGFNKIEIDTQELSNGIYFLNYTTNNSTISKKLIIMK